MSGTGGFGRVTGFDARASSQFCRMRRAPGDPQAPCQGPDGASSHSRNTPHNEGLSPIEDRLCWHSQVMAHPLLGRDCS